MRDSSDEEKIQLPKCGSKGDAEILNEKKNRRILVNRKILEYVSVGETVVLINTMRK